MASGTESFPPRQLALALDHAESYAREDFLSGPCNAGALALIESWPDWPARAIALVGPKARARPIWRAIWAAAAGARVVSAHALDETDLLGALATGALVVEDCRRDPDDRALFHLINLAREEQAFLLFTARTAPALWPVALPDVVSRLRALPVVTLQPPDDAMLRGLIVKLASRPPAHARRQRRPLSFDPYRALLRRGPRRRHRPGQGGAAAGPAAEPGPGGGTVPQCGLTGRLCRDFDHFVMFYEADLTERPPAALSRRNSLIGLS